MQRDYFNNKPKMGGGMIAIIVIVALFVGAVGGAGVYHLTANDIVLDGIPSVSGKPSARPNVSGSATVSPHINPNITQIPPVEPPVIDEDDPIVDLYEKLSDTVVTVYNYKSNQLYGGGSGVIFTEDGHIITNNHNIHDADYVTVKIKDGDELEAVVVGGDSRSDIAVLKITREGKYHAASLGDSSQLKIGQTVVAIGSPVGLSGSLTRGIVSYLNRAIDDSGVRQRLIQTDCALNPGNSGGPLFNLKGEVIGINNRREVYAFTENAEMPVVGVGYAIPINHAKEIALSLMTEGKVTRGAIGITAQTHVDDNKYAGVKVMEVNQGGPAEGAGLKAGDIITEIDNVQVLMMEDLSEQLSYKKVGQKVIVKATRNNQAILFEIVLTVLSE